MHTAMVWFREAKWPCEQPAEDPGVSWAEIALSLARCHGGWLPVKRKTSEGIFFLQRFETDDAARAAGVTLSEQAESAHSIFKQYRSLTPQAVWPSYCNSGRVPSLFWQGFSTWSTGVRVRPQFAYQDAVFADIADCVKRWPNKLKGLPTISFDPVCNSTWPEDLQIEQKHTWKERDRNMTAALHKVRMRRKTFQAAAADDEFHQDCDS